MPGQRDLGFDNMLWKMNLECVWKKIYATLEPLHKHGPVCAIRGLTCLWECMLMAFAHLKPDPKSRILFLFRCVYNAFYLSSVLYGSIASFVVLSRPFFQLAHKALTAFLAERTSVAPPSLPVLSSGWGEFTHPLYKAFGKQWFVSLLCV